MRISDYRFGHIVVDGVEHDRDLIVLPDKVIADWWRRDGHSVVIEDFDGVLKDLPGILIVGSGAYGRMRPDSTIIDLLQEKGVEVEVHETPEAVKRFNSSNPARTAAALHLTC